MRARPSRARARSEALAPRSKLGGEAEFPIRTPNRVKTAALGHILFLSLALAGEPKWLEVPYVAQSESGCGAASIAMVMQYWAGRNPGLDARSADGDHIYQVLPRSKAGISGEALKQYLENNDFQAFVFRGEMQDLRHHLEQGRPLVVGIAPRGPRRPLHYVVVVGIEDNAILFHDPVRGKLMRQSSSEFEREWKTTGNWTLLAVPRQEK